MASSENKDDQHLREREATPVVQGFESTGQERFRPHGKPILQALTDCQIRFYGAFYDEGKVYLALEYMDCGSIKDMIDVTK